MKPLSERLEDDAAGIEGDMSYHSVIRESEQETVALLREAAAIVRAWEAGQVSEHPARYYNSDYLTNGPGGALVEKREAYAVLDEQFLPPEYAGHRVRILRDDTTAPGGQEAPPL